MPAHVVLDPPVVPSANHQSPVDNDQYVEFTDVEAVLTEPLSKSSKAAELLQAQIQLADDAKNQRRRRPCAAWAGGAFGMGLIVLALLLTSPNSPFYHSGKSTTGSDVVGDAAAAASSGAEPVCWIDTSRNPYLINLALGKS